ncbi:endo-1,4-beta-xylanase [uncultured Brevundimonas sp.]|uniref:endo-1,4-beta-xylanase n=1 Tax=uncultured Brevundimonas sp. TaxID=213418 RepID=UPI0030EBED6F|tara:strand:- start:636 stop:1700 length:1065 start_codon:yes stop_codon:yes gene_type:complete
MNRRALLTSLALAPVIAGCRRAAVAGPQPARLPPLKTITPGAFGTCVQLANLTDPGWLDLARTHVSQLTPEWEMKMEYILADGPDRLRLDRSDRIARFAADNGMALHGHTLIWYAQGQDVFSGLDNAAFDRAFDGYIATVAGRYRGKVRSWDVVNEPILDDGSGLRDCHWSRRYGQDGYIRRAFDQARIADPDAVLFLNEYNLEGVPAKGTQFLRLVERLLKSGCPLQGLGTQSHLWIDIPDGQIAAFMHELAQFGLPIHVSELDVSLRTDSPLDLRGLQERLSRQTARVAELAAAYMRLPAAQRFGFTTWGLRDTDSWYRRGDKDDGKDRPLPFDATGRPNPMAGALAAAFQR